MNVSQKNPIVYDVNHVDTEGPLYESVSETFKRIEEIIGVTIPLSPTKNNLMKLQKGEVDFLRPDEIEKIASEMDWLALFNDSIERKSKGISRNLIEDRNTIVLPMEKFIPKIPSGAVGGKSASES